MDEAEKFRQELEWCIKKLEIGLQRQCSDPKQAAETLRILKILKSGKAPMVKKRQAMRNALGDYRKKMKEEEKKSIHGMRHSKFVNGNMKKQQTKSRFLRQSILKLQGNDTQPPSKMSHSLSDDTDTAASTSTSQPSASDLSASIDSLQISQTPGNTNTPQAMVDPALSSSSALGQENQSAIEAELSAESNTPAAECGNLPTAEKFHFSPSNNSFCFSFTSEKMQSDLEINEIHQSTDESSKVTVPISTMSQEPVGNNFTLQKSENDFTFNFASDS